MDEQVWGLSVSLDRANPGHMYAVIAGLRWDTSNTPGDGPGWSETGISKKGYEVRHPTGL